MVGKKFLITTAIDYPSARFHLGHAYEKIATDCIARWKRLNCFDVHFSTGTDCHGLKIQRAAEKENKTPLQFVNEISDGFKELCKVLNISYTDFIMTTENRHTLVAQTLVQELMDKGYVYKADYEGPYCVDCETYYTEKDLTGGKCPFHKTKEIEYIKETSYFFKMSKFREILLQHINDHPEYIFPEPQRNQIIARLKGELRDLSISRKQVSWGIPLPFDPKMTIFVWVEALMNYLTTVDYPNKKYKEYWPAVHVIGRDIVWHHTVIWGALLEALDIKLPQVVVHGFITAAGEKMSKSMKGGADPIKLAETYGVDSLRYFLIREIPFGYDGDFSEGALRLRLNNELVNEYGNLVSRVLTLVEKKLNGTLKRTAIDAKLEKGIEIEYVKKLFDEYKLHDAVSEIFKLIKLGNIYVAEKAPWAEKDEVKINHILYNLCEVLRIISILLSPIMPETSEKLCKQLGIKLGNINDCKFGLIKEYNVYKDEMLFKKIE